MCPQYSTLHVEFVGSIARKLACQPRSLQNVRDKGSTGSHQMGLVVGFRDRVRALGMGLRFRVSLKFRVRIRDTWRNACASGLCTLRQESDQAVADRRSRIGTTQQQLVPDVRSAAECVHPSLACAATFVATPHVLHNAPSSTNVIGHGLV